MASRLGQLQRSGGSCAEVDCAGHGLEVAGNDGLDVTSDARSGNLLRQRGQIGQLHRGDAHEFRLVFIDREVDNGFLNLHVVILLSYSCMAAVT